MPAPGRSLRRLLDCLRSTVAELAFGADGRPFDPRRVGERANAAWKARGIQGLTLHECRHSFASLMIVAGVNAKSLSSYMGHTNIATTFDLSGHLMPGNESVAADLLELFLSAAG